MSNSSRLKQITNRAKEIRRRSGGSWRSALKKAGAELRGKVSKVSRKRKHSGSRKSKKRVGVVFPSGVGSATMNGTIGSHLSQARKMIADRIGDLERQKFTTRLKVDKRRIGKQIAELKKQYRKLK